MGSNVPTIRSYLRAGLNMFFSTTLNFLRFIRNKLPSNQLKNDGNQMFNSTDEIFILFDYSCGRFYTHHSSYLKDYNDFLVTKNKQAYIWVNTSADQEVLDIFTGNVKAILRSNLYSHTHKDHFRYFLIDYLVNLSERFKASQIVNYFLKPYYIRSAVKEFEIHLQKHRPITIIAPTLDGLGLRFVVEILKRYHSKISLVSIRVTGAERRGIFGVRNSLEVLKKLTEQYPNKIHFGFEVKAFETIMQSKEISSKNTFWAPMPHITRVNSVGFNEPFEDVSQIRLGFLGSGRPNKGFDEIPDILDELRSKEINFKAFIQLPKFKWNNFETTLNYLIEKYSQSISFIESSTSKLVLDQAISSMDLIVLPYRLENYKIAGSGVLFLACDFNIPVAATKDLAFTWDIEHYQIGFSFIDAAEFCHKLRSLEYSNLQSKIDIYNKARNQANMEFLKIN